MSGHCCVRLVADDNRPVACFGLDKRPGQKNKPTYLILFKPDPAKRPEGIGIIGAGEGVGFGAHEASAGTIIQIGNEQKFRLHYVFRTDPKKPDAHSTTIAIDGNEMKNAQAHVVLVDLTREKPAFRAIKTALPTSVPELNAGIQEWGSATERIAIREFLGQEN